MEENLKFIQLDGAFPNSDKSLSNSFFKKRERFFKINLF